MAVNCALLEPDGTVTLPGSVTLALSSDRVTANPPPGAASVSVTVQVDVPGDRRDYYVTEPDVWAMFFRILRERKRREFDPALEAVRGLLDKPPVSGVVRERLEQMGELLGTAERVANRFLADPASSRSALKFVAGLPLGKRRSKG